MKTCLKLSFKVESGLMVEWSKSVRGKSGGNKQGLRSVHSPEH